MTKEGFRMRWEESKHDGIGMSIEEVAKYGKEWGVLKFPGKYTVKQILYAVLTAAELDSEAEKHAP